MSLEQIWARTALARRQNRITAARATIPLSRIAPGVPVVRPAASLADILGSSNARVVTHSMR